MKVAVASRSFSKNPFLTSKILELYPEAYFNDMGQSLKGDALVQFLAPAEAAIIALEKIDMTLLQQLPNLRIISKYGVGLDNLDLEALQTQQVRLGYTAGTNKRGVAELALQMILTMLRKSYQSSTSMRQGVWHQEFGRNLSGKNVGILGLGNVGKELVELLAPFKCKLSATELKPDQDFISKHGIKIVNADYLFSQNDIVSIHIPLNKRNRHFIGPKLLHQLSKQAILINTARGGLVDETALNLILREGRLSGAAFDVFEEEPFTNVELLALPNFYSTPHIGGSSVESVQAMGLAAIAGLTSHRPILDSDLIDL